MPLRATDHSFWRYSATDPCWASQESGGLDWDLRPVAAIIDTPETKDKYGEKKDGFFALKLMPAGGIPQTKAGRAAQKGEPAPAVYQPSDGAQVASLQSPILR
jgi:hypothetical protein